MEVSMDLMFTAGTSNGSMQCVDVVITDSAVAEEDETFTVTLTTSSSAVVLGNNKITITILDIGNSMICRLKASCALCVLNRICMLLQ